MACTIISMTLRKLTKMFRTEALRQRIELINHLLEFGRQVILIQGPPGFGKSTMLDAIEESTEPDRMLIRFNAGRTLNRDSLLEKISVNLDFEPTEKFSEGEICDEIYRRLEILEKSNQIVIVAIDDAHELPSETHSLLLTLAHNDDAPAELRVVLAADSNDPSLLDNLHSNADQKALIHTVDIPNMNREQTASLLSWWQDQQNTSADREVGKFSSATIDEIHDNSEGVPGDIITLARQHQLRGANTQLRSDPVKKYIAIGLFAFLAVAIFSFFGKDIASPEEQQLDIDLPVPAEKIEAPSTEVAVSSSSSGSPTTNADTLPEATAVAGVPPNNLDMTLEVLPEPNKPEPLSNTGELDDMLSAQLAEGVLPDIESSADVKEESTDKTSPEKPPSSAQEQQQETQVKANAVDEPPAPQVLEQLDQSANDLSIAAKQNVAAPKVSVKIRSQEKDQENAKPANPSPPAKPEPRVVKEKTAYSLAKLLRESPNGYVLQLFGVRDHDAASKYIAKHGIGTNSAVVASMHEGSPWYVVIYGQYDSRQKASAAVAGISQKLPNIKPWPRPVSSLK